ncbi:MAG: response regulator transcription factor [Gemmatimonadaceae bacterium]|nr:response regulator transcription factor [Gemmatimonadaceae bacterium]
MTHPIARILIVDDERLARVRVAECLRAIAPNVALEEAADGATAARLVESWRPDAVFLDVQMPEMDGFAVVQAVGVERMPPTVFVTAHDQHAVHAFDVAAVDYLLKPFDDERFAAAWERLRARAAAGTIAAEARRVGALLTSLGAAAAAPVDLAAGPTEATIGATGVAPAARGEYADRMVVRRDQRTYFVRLADVQWIESSGNYVILHAGKERHELRETLSALESRLDPRRFTRIHRRLIVALDAIRELQPWFGGDQVMILHSGAKLRVSRTHRASLERALRGE